MKLLRAISGELFGMFLADAKLSGAILILVAGVAYFVEIRQTVSPLIGGVVLLLGCLSILIGVTALEARRRRHKQ